MKLTLAIAVMASCLFLTCVTAKADNYDKSQEVRDSSVKDYEGPVVFSFKARLQECAMRGAFTVMENSEKMIADIEDCRVNLSEEAEAVTEFAKEVIHITKNVFSIYKSCDYSIAPEQPNHVSLFECIRALLEEIKALYNQIGLTIQLIKKVPVGANQCATITLCKYRDELTGFPRFMEECFMRRQES
ncbi:uncharacterized protein LOC119643101 isoform X2 [Glossina fuscipes]|uniref:Uncharacterized protein LOC119643101 isoform X2 n=1 Tax=Glossina fuscipes TaxID=7396 RepID=A0A9C5ZDB4_9MUSC|nr:uncharacterized protein LOC119643101 isoform X2 [Glossina fuscipes]